MCGGSLRASGRRLQMQLPPRPRSSMITTRRWRCRHSHPDGVLSTLVVLHRAPCFGDHLRQHRCMPHIQQRLLSAVPLSPGPSYPFSVAASTGRPPSNQLKPPPPCYFVVRLMLRPWTPPRYIPPLQHHARHPSAPCSSPTSVQKAEPCLDCMPSCSRHLRRAPVSHRP